jgi:hypothetical protein
MGLGFLRHKERNAFGLSCPSGSGRRALEYEFLKTVSDPPVRKANKKIVIPPAVPQHFSAPGQKDQVLRILSATSSAKRGDSSFTRPPAWSKVLASVFPSRVETHSAR